MIVIVGVAGAGKSVQSERLAKTLGCPWLGMGMLLRSKMGPQEQAKMLTGEMLEDHFTLGVLDEELQRIDASKNEFILDGFPRRPSQADWLIEKIENGQLKLTALIHLKAGKNTAKQRLLQRGRSDDSEPAITERFSEYDQTIKPILNMFEKAGISAFEIDGEQEVEVIHNQLLKIVGHEA